MFFIRTPKSAELDGWTDLLREEEASWAASNTTAAQIVSGEKKLNMEAKFIERIQQIRNAVDDGSPPKELRKTPQLVFLRPAQGTPFVPAGFPLEVVPSAGTVQRRTCARFFIKVRAPCYAGPYCELMQDDSARLHSLVKKLRWKYDSTQLLISNMTMPIDMPLCEVFFVGPSTDPVRIFYARGGSLQVNASMTLTVVGGH